MSLQFWSYPENPTTTCENAVYPCINETMHFHLPKGWHRGALSSVDTPCSRYNPILSCGKWNITRNKTLDHTNEHTSLRPRKLSTFIVIVRHDDEHGHHAARHCNAFVYSSPRHNNDKTSENAVRATQAGRAEPTRECCTRVRLGCVVREGKTPLLVADTGVVSLRLQRQQLYHTTLSLWVVFNHVYV